jgi:hypothetical protein
MKRDLLLRQKKRFAFVAIRHLVKTAEVPANKHWLIYDGKARKIEGVVVHAANKEKAYLPLQAVNMIKGSTQALPSIMAGSKE